MSEILALDPIDKPQPPNPDPTVPRPPTSSLPTKEELIERLDNIEDPWVAMIYVTMIMLPTFGMKSEEDISELSYDYEGLATYSKELEEMQVIFNEIKDAEQGELASLTNALSTKMSHLIYLMENDPILDPALNERVKESIETLYDRWMNQPGHTPEGIGQQLQWMWSTSSHVDGRNFNMEMDNITDLKEWMDTIHTSGATFSGQSRAITAILDYDIERHMAFETLIQDTYKYDYKQKQAAVRRTDINEAFR